MFIMESFGRGVYLWTYEGIKNALDGNELIGSVSQKVCSAACAGCFSWFVVYPCDVIKSRMQMDVSCKLYQSFFDCLFQTYKEGGIRALSRGMLFTMIRAAPVASVVLPIYDYVHRYFEYYDTL